MVWFCRFRVALLAARICPPALLKLPLPPLTVAVKSPLVVEPDGLPANMTPFWLLVSALAVTFSACVPSSVPFWFERLLSAVTLTVWPPIRPVLTTSVPCTVVVAPPSVPVLVIVVPVAVSELDAVTVPAFVTVPPVRLAELVAIVPAVATLCVPVAVSVPLTWLVVPALPNDTLVPLRLALPPTTGSAAMETPLVAVAVRLPAVWLLPVSAMLLPAASVVSPTLAVLPLPVMSWFAETPSLPRVAT